MNLRAVYLSLFFCCSSTVCHAAEDPTAEPRSDPPHFIYSFTGTPQVETTSVIAEALVQLAERGNKPYLERLKRSLVELDTKRRLEDAFGCILVPIRDQVCRRVQLLNDAPVNRGRASDELANAAKEYAPQGIWAFWTTEQFFADGYNFSIRAVELKTSETEVEVVRQLQVLYMNFFSAGADAQRRGLPRGTKDATPRLGSKDAREAYWFSGEPSLIESLVASGPSKAAASMQTLIVVAGTDNDSFRQAITSKPKLRQLRAQGLAACKTIYCSMHVYDEAEDRLRVMDLLSGGIAYLVSVNRWGLE